VGCSLQVWQGEFNWTDASLSKTFLRDTVKALIFVWYTFSWIL